MPSKLTVKFKKELCTKVENLSTEEFKFIFRIIHNDDNKYVENANGVWVNLNEIKDDTIQKIATFLKNLEATEITKKKLKKESSKINKASINKIDIQNHSNYDIRSAFGIDQTKSNANQDLTNIALTNYEKSILKKNKYITEQRHFKDKLN